MKRKLKIAGIVLASLLVVIVTGAFIAGIKPISLGMHSPVYKTSGTALKGYDVVAYFNGTPAKGNENFSADWNGAKWLFASATNLEAFKADPNKFMPQYGGYCTFAVSKGFTAPADPSIWLIKDDKLYIFSDEKVKEEFVNDPRVIINSCNKEWKN